MQELDWCLRMLLAALCGGIIGFERKSKAKTAGTRTHALIALGAALAMIVSKYGFFDLLRITHQNWSVDPSRIAAQVVSGIGFLGAGTILNRHDHVINGLTTPAGIWVTGTICVLIAEMLGKYIDQFALRRGREFSCFLLLDGGTKRLYEVIDQLNHQDFRASLKHTVYSYQNGTVSCRLFGELKPGVKTEEIFTELANMTSVKKVELE